MVPVDTDTDFTVTQKNFSILQNYPVAKPGNVFDQNEHDPEKMIS
jgi:hypothetical protein